MKTEFTYFKISFRIPNNFIPAGLQLHVYFDEAGRSQAMKYIAERDGSIEHEAKLNTKRFDLPFGEWSIYNTVFFEGEQMRKVNTTVTTWVKTCSSAAWVMGDESAEILKQQIATENKRYRETHPVWL